MKKIILGLLLMFQSISFSQEYKIEELSVTGVFEVPGKTKPEIYSLINKWISKSYASTKSVIQLNDPESGSIVIRGNQNFNIKFLFKPLLGSIFQEGDTFDRFNNSFAHLIEIDIKDNKYRIKYTITDVLEGSYFSINTIEVFKGINFVGSNDTLIDYDAFTNSFIKSYSTNLNNKNKVGVLFLFKDNLTVRKKLSLLEYLRYS